jgi:hypothetical protein
MQSLYEEHARLVAAGIDGSIKARNCNTHIQRTETVEEVQAAIQKWLGGKDKNSNRWFSFSRVPHKTTLRVWIAHSAPDVKVELNERWLLFQCKNQKLNLNIAKDT